MTPPNEARLQAEFRQGASAIAQLGGKEHTETTPNPNPAQRQTEARQCEGIARRHAIAALGLCGTLALQQVALSRYYACRSVALMREAVR